MTQKLYQILQTILLAILLTILIPINASAQSTQTNIDQDPLQNNTTQNNNEQALIPQKNSDKITQPDLPNDTHIKNITAFSASNKQLSGKEKISSMLSNHCILPSKKELLNIDLNAEQILFEIADDNSMLQTTRMRAIQVLTYFPGEHNLPQLYEILNDPNKPRRIKIRAITAISTIDPINAPIQLKELYIKEKDENLKFAIIATLQRTESNNALNALHDLKQFENNKLFIKYINKAINKYVNTKNE